MQYLNKDKIEKIKKLRGTIDTVINCKNIRETFEVGLTNPVPLKSKDYCIKYHRTVIQEADLSHASLLQYISTTYSTLSQNRCLMRPPLLNVL